jgi:hypothetical protein
MRDDENGNAPAGENGEGIEAASANRGRQEQIAGFEAMLEPLFASGYELIPLHHPGDLDRKGRKVGKAPLHRKWRTMPALSLEGAVEHLARGGNVGVRLRDTDLVVDVDPRNFAEGDDPLARLRRDFDLPESPAVVTGGGGTHLFLTKPADARVAGSLKAYPGVEFKSLGRQVVAIGSVHPDTRRRYEPDPMALAAFPDVPEAPQRLLGALGVQDIARSAEAGMVEPEELAVLLDALDPARFPDNATWEPIMMACHHATAGQGRDEFIAWSTSDPAFSDREWEIGNRWDSLKPDAERPRTVRTLLDAIGDVAEGPAAEMRRLLYAQLDFAADPFDPADLAALLQATAPKPKPPARNRFLSIDEIMAMPDPEWLVKGVIPKGGVGLLVGQSQAYKSFLALHLALCLSTGSDPHPDHPAAGTYETIFVAGEGAGGFKLRIKAWMKAHPELRPAMRLQTFPSYLDKEAEAKALAAAIRDLAERDGKRHRLLVVDTFSANFTGKENTDDAAGFIRHCHRIAQASDVTVLVIHHLGKDGDKGARGHSSLTGNTDFWMTLERPDMGKRTVRLRPGKLKDAPTDHELWFEAASVVVADCGEFTDSLVLKPTQRPRVETTTTGNVVTDDILEQIAFILDQVQDGDGVPGIIKVVTELGLSRMTAERRVEEILEGMPHVSIEKLGGGQNNRRVFRVSPT